MSEDHSHALPKGYRIDEYEIVRVLGAGGFGITYLAFDHQLDGPVALKEYFPAGFAARAADRHVTASSTESREVFAWGLDRFIAEARMVHRFHHPNVVRVHRYIKSHGTAYIVMEYVEGKSLAAVLKDRGRLTPAEWRPWFDALLDGLAHIHARGYLHRDIKPGNIVIRAEDGAPVLIDFGSARVTAAERTHTQVLSPDYAPIEQHSKKAAQGPYTDIYALAAVSCRALTGEPPPSAPDRLLQDEYAPLADRLSDAPESWLAGLDKALAVRPEDRPQTVTAWQAALKTPGHAPAPPPAPNPHPTPAARGRQPTSAMVLLWMALAIAAGLTVGYLVMRVIPTPGAVPAVETPADEQPLAADVQQLRERTGQGLAAARFRIGELTPHAPPPRWPRAARTQNLQSSAPARIAVSATSSRRSAPTTA